MVLFADCATAALARLLSSSAMSRSPVDHRHWLPVPDHEAWGHVGLTNCAPVSSRGVFFLRHALQAGGARCVVHEPRHFFAWQPFAAHRVAQPDAVKTPWLCVQPIQMNDRGHLQPCPSSFATVPSMVGGGFSTSIFNPSAPMAVRNSSSSSSRSFAVSVLRKSI